MKVSDHVPQRLRERDVSSVLHGDPDRTGVIRQGVKSRTQETLPGHRHRDDRPGSEG